MATIPRAPSAPRELKGEPHPKAVGAGATQVERGRSRAGWMGPFFPQCWERVSKQPFLRCLLVSGAYLRCLGETRNPVKPDSLPARLHVFHQLFAPFLTCTRHKYGGAIERHRNRRGGADHARRGRLHFLGPNWKTRPEVTEWKDGLLDQESKKRLHLETKYLDLPTMPNFYRP